VKEYSATTTHEMGLPMKTSLEEEKKNPIRKGKRMKLVI